jgi:hypothetical protein
MEAITMHEWHVLSNDAGTVLAVYGGALLSMAQEKAREIEHATGCPVYRHTIMGTRPHVGSSISMAGATVCS